MDFADFTTDDSAKIEILNPSTGAPTGASITVAGVDSDIYKAAQRKQVNRRLANMQRAGKSKMTAEVMEEEAMALLIACVVSWENVSFKGEELDCTPENVRLIFDEVTVVKEQVDEAIADRSLFTKG